jgi:hypothetical protein
MPDDGLVQRVLTMVDLRSVAQVQPTVDEALSAISA